MKKIKTFLSLSLLMICSLSWAQNIKITGKVTDASDGSPLTGAAVVIKGVAVGETTDLDGIYSINAPSNATLIFSFIGMNSVEVPVNGRTVIDVVLESSNVLDEVVVTAMGISRQEKSLGYSATTVKSDEIAVSRSTNVTNALQGKIAGVTVQATSSDPGAASSVIIRGFGSINGSNQPLYVVDGVPLQNSYQTTQGHAMSLSGISNIASDDIESMTVLKGAAATALYGSRAANGVILISTKQGKKGDMKNFSISYNGGVQFRQVATLPTFQNDFGQGWNGQQTFIENGSWGPKLDGSQQIYGPIWNGQQLIHAYSAVPSNVRDFFDIGISQNHSVSLGGVSDDEKMNYYLSFSYTGDDGIIPTNSDSYERMTISFRNNWQAAKWLRISSSVNFANTSTDMVGSYQGTSVIDGLYELPRDVSLVDMKDLTLAFNTPEAYFTPYGITNPYWSLENNYNHISAKQLNGKAQIDIKPIQSLTFSYRFGFDYTDRDRKIGYPQISLDDALIEEDYGYAPSNMNQDGYVYTNYGRSYELNHDVLASYNDAFVNKKLTLDVNVGLNINERYSTAMAGETDGLTFYTGFWDLSNGATKTTLTESQSKRRLIGLFGDITIGWNNMIFLNATGRNDWSSTLPIANNHYFYPGATLSWIFTELIPKNNFLTFGKIRAAYGKTGNDAGVYQTTSNFVQSTARGYYGTDIALFPMNNVNSFISSTTAGSSTLRPEMTTEIEAGINLQFFKGRIGIDAAFYNRVTSDQIFTLPVDPSTGYSYMVTNFGEVRNRGVEILLSTTPVHTRDFRWDLDFNFSKNYNKVLSMPESVEGGRVTIYSFSAGNDAVYMYAEEGQPMGTYYTYLPQYVTDESSPYYGSPIVGADGQPVLGTSVENTGFNMNYKWTGGVTTSLNYRGLQLAATLDVRYGGKMFSRTKNLMQFTGNGIETIYNGRRPFVVPNSVQEVDGGYVENNVPIYLKDSSYQDYFNDYGWGQGGMSYLVDRSYAKLRNITLGYTLPAKWSKAIYLSQITLSLFVNNAFTWTAADNYYVDPELTTTGSDLAGQFGELYANPACRVYGFNLNIKF